MLEICATTRPRASFLGTSVAPRKFTASPTRDMMTSYIGALYRNYLRLCDEPHTPSIYDST